MTLEEPNLQNFFSKRAFPVASFCLFFCLNKQTLQFLQQIYVKKCPSCLRCWDLNPRPSGQESHPITTTPGLRKKLFCTNWSFCKVPHTYINILMHCIDALNEHFWPTSLTLIVDPHLKQQHAGFRHSIFQPYQKVTRPMARFKPTSPKKSEVDGRIWAF